MLSVLLFIITQQTLAQPALETTKCHFKREIETLLCAKKNYQPEDVIGDATNRPITISFQAMTNDMVLSIPENYIQSNLAEYKSFRIIDSCVVSIEENFFANLDNKKNKLKKISFSRVRCLQRLETRSFNEIGRFVERLQFEFLPDLYSIESGFFNSFTVLTRLSISNTGIMFIPEDIFTKVPSLEILKIYNNKLMSLPLIPSDRPKLLSNIEAHGNPFDCVCPLMEFIRKMTASMRSQNYRCSTPFPFFQKRLQEVGDLCTITTEEIKNFKRVEDISLGQIRLKIIIAIAVTLVIIVILITVVLILKNKKKSKEKTVYMAGSPSRIVFQNEDYNDPLIRNRSQMV